MSILSPVGGPPPNDVPPPDHPFAHLIEDLNDCLDLLDPEESEARARTLLDADTIASITNSRNTELIGLACMVARHLAGPQASTVAAQLLVPPVCRQMAEEAHDHDFSEAVNLAHKLPTPDEVKTVLSTLLPDQVACERMARMARTAAEQASQIGLVPDELTTPTCRAIGRSNSFRAIGETACAIGFLPEAHRDDAAEAAEALLTTGACVATGMSGDVKAVMQVLDAIRFVPPRARSAAWEALLTRRACAAVVASRDPAAISRAAMAAVGLAPGWSRDEVLRDLLTEPACELVAKHGEADHVAGAAMAATMLPAGAARDTVLERLLDLGACAHVEEMGDVRAKAETAYAATFLNGRPQVDALGQLITNHFCDLMRETRDPSWSSMAFFAASCLQDEGERHIRLAWLLSGRAIEAVAANGSHTDVQLALQAVQALPEGHPMRMAALRQLEPRIVDPAPPDWRVLAARPLEPAARAARAPSPGPGAGP